MAEPFSIASGIAGKVTLSITLSTAAITAGYKYINSVSSAPEELQSLVRETASLRSVLSQFFLHFMSEEVVQDNEPQRLAQQNILQDCEDILHNVQSLVSDCETISGARRKNLLHTLTWPLKQKEIDKNCERISRLCINLHAMISTQSATTLRILERGQINDRQVVDKLARDSNKAQEQKILEWLSVLEPAVKQAATAQLIQTGTNEWFFKEKAIAAWLEYGKLFWLHGSSGTGKTVLISKVINHIIDNSTNGHSLVRLAYHYCDFANPPTLDPAKIMGSLVRQLTQQMDGLAPAVQNLYHKRSTQPPDLNMLFEVLESITEQSFETTYLIIDGLDESPKESRQLFLSRLLQLYKPSKNLKSLRVLVSSRPLHDIKLTLSTTPSFGIKHSHVAADIETHVSAELAKNPKLRALPLPVQEELKNDLVQRSDGMFRWIQCQLDSLRKIRTLQSLKQALQSLPMGLDETYDRILNSIEERDYQYVLRMFHWLVGSERPLSVQELAEAIALNPSKELLDAAERLLDPEDIFELCGSLIRVEKDQTIVLAHFSVKEYLLCHHLASKGGHLARFALDPSGNRRHLTMCMLSYMVSIGLRIRDLQKVALDEAEYPLLSYIRRADFACFRDFKVMDAWMQNHLFANKVHDNEWLILLDYVKAPACNEINYGLAWFIKTVLQCALMCFWNGNAALLGELQEQGKDLEVMSSVHRVASLFLRLQRDWEVPENAVITMSTSFGSGFCARSPLCAAAAFNFDHVLRFLLQNGALVDGIPSLQYTGNPLSRALNLGNKTIVRTLIQEFGADTSVRNLRENCTTALMSAAASGKGDEMVRYLIDTWKVNTNLPDSFGRTIHYWAFHNIGRARGLQALLTELEPFQEREVDFLDTRVLYSSIMVFLKELRANFPDHRHYGLGPLSLYLFHAGPEYYEYAAAFAEHNLVRGNKIEHRFHCDLCVSFFGPDIRGQRFICLDCCCVDLCANCHASWQKSNGEMDFCKGHRFYEIPRPCWYQFPEGVVMEDGSTFPQIVEFLEGRFTQLLESVASV